MAAVIVHAGPRHARGAGENRRLETGELRIGRAPSNDLVLADPFVGAAQFRLVREGDGVVLEVLDRTNPVSLNGRRREDARIVLVSGDEVEVGHSVVCVLREDAIVAPTRVLPSTWWARLGNARPAAATAAFLATLATSLWMDYLVTVDAVRWDELASGTLTLGAMVLSWAALWAVLGRSIRHQASFADHLALACAVTLAAFALTTLIDYGLYAVDAAHGVEGLDWAGGALLLVGLAYGEFRLATHFRRPGVAALAVVLLPLGLLGGFEWSARSGYDPQPPAEGLLFAPAAKIAPSRSPEAYDELLGALFSELRAD